VLLPLVLAGLNAAVTPLGSPEAESATLLLKPSVSVTPMVAVALPPCATLKVAAEVERVKLGACTVTLRFSVFFRLPEVPVTVTGTVPPGAKLPAVSVSVLVPDVEAGLNEAVTPEGKPEALNATLPPKPFTGFTVIFAVPVAPGFTETEAGAADRLKEG
jgi:hypothetical protein